MTAWLPGGAPMLATKVLVVFLLMAHSASPQAAAEKQPSGSDDSLLSIEAVDVDPPQPGPDTLCKLKVRLRNKGTEIASDFAFEVTLNGQPIPVYANHVWSTNLAPGKTAEVPLYNFWTTETGRPAPKDGRLVVQVRLKAARWHLGQDQAALSFKDVAPLPPPRSLTLTMATKGS